MSIEAIGWAFKKCNLNDPTAKFVLIAICNYADEDDKAWPSHATIARITGYSKRTIQAAVGRLEDAGVITRTERARENGSQSSSTITIKVGVAFGAIGGIAADGEGVVQPLPEGIATVSTPEPSLNLLSESSKKVAALAAPEKVQPVDLEKQYFDRSVEVLKGPPNDARKLAGMLFKACGRNISEARSDLEKAAGRSDAKRFLLGCVHHRKKQANAPSDATVLMTNADDRHVLM